MEKRYPPGPPGELLFGNIREFGRDRLRFVTENHRQYGDVVHARFFNRNLYMLYDPDDIQYVLVKAPEKFEKSPLLKKATQLALGNGLLLSEGAFHKRQRKLAQPAFHHQRIANYADVMVAYTERMLADWQQGDQRDMHHEMMKLTMEIVAKTLFDADVSQEADSIGEAITTAIELASARMSRPLALPLWIPTPTNRRTRQAVAVVDARIQQIIAQRRAHPADQGDLLSMLLLAKDEETGAYMNDQQVRDEAMTLFIAGHETTANALAWTLYLLAQHPDVSAKLVAELDTVLAGRSATMQDLRQLTYTDQVVKESMRLYPPAWIFARLAIEDVTLGGYPVEKGSVVMVSSYALHRDPRYWAAPETFDPDHFAPGWEERVPRYAYIPFGGGPRVCIGNSFAMMEAVLCLATIMQRCRLSLIPGQQITPEPLITLRPDPGIDMRVHLRERVPAAV